MPFSPKIIGNPILPAIHGGMTGAFLETTAILGVRRELGIAALPKPIGLTVNYLRSGRALDTFANVSIVKQGRRIVAFEARAWQDDRGQADRLRLRSFHAAADARKRRGIGVFYLDGRGPGHNDSAFPARGIGLRHPLDIIAMFAASGCWRRWCSTRSRRRS